MKTNIFINKSFHYEKPILAVLFILPLFLQAQNKWEINLSGYQNYSFSPVLRSDKNGMLGFMLGGYSHLHLKRNLFFVTGLEFLQFGYKRKGDFSQMPIEYVNGQYVRDPLLDDDYKNQRYFFQIPFELRVQFPQKKVVPFVQGGLIKSFLIGYRSKSKDLEKETKTSKLTPFDQIMLGARLSFGFGVPLSNHRSLTIAAFAYSAFAYSGIQNSNVRYKYRAFGLNLGYLFGQ